MSDMLSIGSSALQAYRTALNVVSNNIANANTQGYSRESVDLQAQTGVTTSIGTVGTGVAVQSVQRTTSSYLQAQLVGDSSSFNRISTLQGYASQLDSLLSTSSTGLSGPMQTFFTDLNSLAANPTSTAARQTVLTDAQGLSSTFNGLQQQMDTMSSQLGKGLSATATQVNGYASQLAQLNLQISQASGQGQAPNALLDQRDQLLQNISADVGISTVTNTDGSVNVFLASGQPLVLGTNANTLSVQPGAYGQGQDVVLTSGKTQTVVTSQLSGGSMGGILDFQRQILDPASDQLGQLALGLSTAVNTQQALGMNQNGQLGGALFSTPAVPVTAASTNGGSASVSATVSAIGQLNADDQVLSYNGQSWTMTDAKTGAQTALTGTGTAADPLTGGGLSLTLSGTAASGDKYLVQPTRDAAAGLQVAITDPAAIAAASALQTAASTSNAGSATISSATITDAGNSALLSTATIQFTSASSYSINGAGTYTLTSGSPISVNGWQVQLSGTPAAGDSFTVKANTAGSGDGSNAQALASVINNTLLNGGNDSLTSANAALVSTVGSQAQQAATQLSAQTAIQTQAQTAASSVSGVNLDEEAASMMQFQQAYQAAAQVIATSNTIFQSLLTAIQA
jgi:flagellar hook-associated protein 1 FlgK